MLGEKISDLLKLRGMTQTDLSRITGIPKQTINSIIKRDNKGIDFSAMEKIADALEVPIEYFKESTPNTIKIESTSADGLSKKDMEFLNAISSLTSSNRRILLGIAEVLLREQSANPDSRGTMREK